jgi:hypothetical protein
LGGTLAVGALLLGASLEILACDEPYDPPCKVVADEVLVTDPGMSLRPALRRSRGRAVASWPRLESFDAGAEAGPAEMGRVSVAAFEVAVVNENGELGLRANVPAPDALRARLGGLTGEGVVVLDDALLVHWIETTETSEPNGIVRTDAALRAVLVRDGNAAPLDVSVASCQRCSMLVAPAALGSESIVFVRMDPDPAPATLGTAVRPSFAALRVRRDGAVLEEPVPWLSPPAPPSTAGATDAATGGLGGRGASSPAPDLFVDVDSNGRIVVVTGGFAWLADEALRVLAGPLALPSADARVSWDIGGEATVLWSASPYEDGRSTSEIVPREIFTGLVSAGSSGIATRERASRGRVALALDRSGQDVGALFESASRAIFIAVDPRGSKRGGDVILRGAMSTTPSEYGTIEAPAPSALFARGGGRFTVVRMGTGALRAAEIVCAP